MMFAGEEYLYNNVVIQQHQGENDLSETFDQGLNLTTQAVPRGQLLK
jgi:hypothetical protein